MSFPPLNLPTDGRNGFQALLTSAAFFDSTEFDREKIIYSILQMGNYCRDYSYNVSYKKLPKGKCKVVTWNGNYEICNESNQHFIATFSKL